MASRSGETHRFPTSTNVSVAYFDPQARQILVDFESGRRYLYSAVTENVWRAFLKAESPGKFVLNTLVKYGPREVSR